NSLLMVNAENLGGNAALSGNVLKVADSAKLYLDNISDGGVYTIANFTDTAAAKGWYTDSANIITNKLFGTAVTGNQVTASRKKLADVLPGAVLPNIVDNMTFSQQDREDNPAVRYIAMATGGLHTDAQSTELINVAAQPAEVVGATATALANSTDFADQAQSHLSFLNESDVVDDQAWVKYGHRKGTLSGLGLGGMDADYDTSYNSVTVGYDLASIDDFHHGIAVSYGKGSSDAALEHNDFNTKGISWYGSFKHGDNNMMMDIGYYHTQHDVTGLLQAKPDTDVFTMGITNEFRFPLGKANEDGSVTGNNAIIPHVGVRYSHIGTPSYTGYYDGGEAFRYHPSGKNIFTLPLGVGFVSENRTADWVTRFYADVAYVPVIGGRSADMHVRAAGIDAEDVFAYDASYGSSFVGSIGVKQESDSFEWGLSYRYSGNSDWHNNDIMANVAWKF
ncbi:MAG: autotransporter outer membrane beta-barrel domain-containing protein, partial [Selenomonadaceae bacterium]|nr:autotransporter outer membrane beta-barrel domain-containing protein [Selenomonadaceae bacterium]